MIMPKLSFVLPIYDVEAYLPRALQSIREQTFGDWEAILVDDGSPDRCGEICDEAARADPRFRVIHQANAGTGAARNAGLEAARGEYVHFFDPDDYLEPCLAQEALRLAEESGADIVMFGFYTELQRADGTTSRLSRSRPPVLGTFDYAGFQREYPKLITFHYIWNRLYRRALLEENHCRYSNHTLGQDAVFNVRTCAKPFGCMVSVETPCLHYTVREGSSVNRYHADRMADNFYISREIAAMIRGWGMQDQPEFRNALAYCALRDLQLGIKNAALSPMSLGERRRWLRGIMADGRLREAVRIVPLSRFRAVNDRVKLLLLKLHAYAAVVFAADVHQRKKRGR